MKRLLALAFLLGLTGAAMAQTFPLNNIPLGKGQGKQGWTALPPGSDGTCLLVTAGVPIFSACPATAPGGTNGQIQYNNAGAFGGFTPGGDLTFANPNFTIANNAVSNAKLATTTQNTVKGAATSTAVADLAVPSCSGANSTLQWTTNTGFQCNTSHVAGSGAPTIGDLAAYTNSNGLAIAGTGYNAQQIPGLIPTTSTVTISNASPGVVTWNSHGLTANTPVWFCNSGGALPTGLTACIPSVGTPVSANNYKSNPTLYYVVGSSITTNTFTVATSIANAKAGTAVNTSSAGSGTHTAFANGLAPAGTIGEMIWNTVEVGSPVAITTATPAIWNTMSLTAGIWELGGNVAFIGTSGTTIFSTWHSNLNFGVGTQLSTSPYDGIDAAHISTNDPSGIVLPYTPNQIFLTGTTTINAVGQGAFAGGTAGIYGKIYARRVR